MNPTFLLPDSTQLRLESMARDDAAQVINLEVATTPRMATCPSCGQASARVHSRYSRTLADLPWAGWSVRLHLQAGKFRCTTPNCVRTIFTERLPAIAAPWARRTRRLAAAQRTVGLALGGAAGARLTTTLAIPAGIDTLLTLVRRTPAPSASHPRVVGIDDWTRRKGQTYATIVVDLETRRPLALLPERSAACVAQWFHDHPGVEIISRDRGAVYAEGATTGAPTAIHVADRWHILKNLGEALLRVLQQYQAALECALVEHPSPSDFVADSLPVPVKPTPPDVSERLARPLTRREQEHHQRRTARLARYERVQILHTQGWSLHAIAAQLGLDRKTVRKYARMDPTRAAQAHTRAPRSSLLDPYRPYILERWNAGCRNAMQILREIQAQGYPGQRSILRSYVAQIRSAQGLPPRSRSIPPGRQTTAPPPKPPSVRTLTWLMLQRPERLNATEQDQVARGRQVHADIDRAVALAQEFAAMVRARQHEHFDHWLERVAASGIGAIRNFVTSLRQDEAAVRAALRLPWSNGPTEGHINRLKLLKRQAYGRAKLDLLEQRLLAA